MPVLPLVGSSSSRPGSSSPGASASSIIFFATRSLMEPVGFCPSSFAKIWTLFFGERRGSSTSGVLPISSSTEWDSGLVATGHRGQEDQLRAGLDGRLEPVERAHVLAVQVDVDEGRDVAVLVDLRAQPRILAREVLEQLADGGAGHLDLPLVAGLGAQRGRDADSRHACTGPAQNST